MPKPSYSYLEVLETIIDCETVYRLETLMDILDDDSANYTAKQMNFIGMALKQKYFKLKFGTII